MDYKSTFVPLAGRSPAKLAEQLAKEMSDLASKGYDTFAVTPVTHDDGSTLGYIVSARKAA